MGVQGAALGTVISKFIEMGIMFYFVIKELCTKLLLAPRIVYSICEQMPSFSVNNLIDRDIAL
jgi:Na+-driven multidrug efflux pump